MRILFILLLVIPIISQAEIIKPDDELCLLWNKHPEQDGDSTFKYRTYYIEEGENRLSIWVGASLKYCFIAKKIMNLSKAKHCFRVRPINEFGSGPLSNPVCILNKAGKSPVGKVTGIKIERKKI